MSSKSIIWQDVCRETKEMAMRLMFVVALAGLVLDSASLVAQVPGGHAHGNHSGTAQPYAGAEMRAIKALSEQQVADLNAGRGMGLAMAAELNGYPGPTHVLELADTLRLSSDVRNRVQALVTDMKAEATSLGVRVIAEEAALDRLFKEANATRELVDMMTSRIGVLQGALRASHLRYHLVTRDLLTPEQIADYSRHRGYR
jgi:hypothetical protein